MLDGLKQRQFRRNLETRRRAVRPVTPSPAAPPTNLATARTIALLYPADDAEQRKKIDRWRDKLAARVEALGYFSADVGSTSFDFTVVSPKTLNWYGAPTGEAVEKFLRTPCDLLLRLGPAGHRELDYLAALKPAGLRVGPRSADVDTPYHLQYDNSGSQGPSDDLRAIERLFSFTNASTPS